MGVWENHQIKKKVKKENKKIANAEKKAELLRSANDTLTDLAERRGKAQLKVKSEEQYQNHLDRSRLEDEITEAKANLYSQREKLVRRLIRSNREYAVIYSQPNTPMKQRELDRCRTSAKNAAYALSIVGEAIDRLDTLPSEFEWRQIMRDLTKGYKLVNSISLGSDLITRLAFLWQKAKSDIKQNISVESMEHYYGRSIDRLLEEQNIDKAASEMLVKDEALQMTNEQQILEAIRYGTIYTIPPSELADAAQDQSVNARRRNQTAIYDDPDEVFEKPMDLEAALDNLPSMM